MAWLEASSGHPVAKPVKATHRVVEPVETDVSYNDVPDRTHQGPGGVVSAVGYVVVRTLWIASRQVDRA